MNKQVLLLATLLLVGCTSTQVSQSSSSTPLTNDDSHISKVAAPKVILKLDDLKYDKNNVVDKGWSQVIEYLKEQKVVGTIGLIGKSLEPDTPDYFEWIKQRDKEGYEVWHHGYCHCRWDENGTQIREFRGSTFELQQQYLLDTQTLAEEKLGITLRTFGAPYNSTDKYTAEILEKMEDLKVWLFKDTEYSSNKYVLPRIKQVNIEYPVHIPDFEKFKSGFTKHQDKDVLIIQGHPRSWVKDPNRFEEFKSIIAYLKSQNVEFTTPYKYYLTQIN